MSNQIKWQEPPADKRRRPGESDIDPIVDALKANPGQWALVREGVSSSAMQQWKKRGCQTRTCLSATKQGKSDVYARWPERDAA